MNHEGYPDPTAEQAIRNYNKLTHSEKEALYHLNQIASLLGFERDINAAKNILAEGLRHIA